MSALLWMGLALAGDAGRCQQAMAHESLTGWARYLERHPDGSCAELAYRRMSELADDARACRDARIDNTLVAWSAYASRYPTGACGVEAASELLTRRQRGERLPEVVPDDVRHDGAVVQLSVLPDLGEGWHVGLHRLSDALEPCETTKPVQVVLAVTPSGPASAEAAGGDEEAALCVLRAFREHPWPTPQRDAELSATVAWPQRTP